MANDKKRAYCSEINKLNGVENQFKQYCKEYGNLTVLDPAGAIANNGVDQENFIIYATLKASVKQKSLVHSKADEKVLEVNFLNGKQTQVGEAPLGTSFLSTNWTEISSVDSKLGQDLETFGMTNIDINLKPAIWPIITIDFEDIRGATLFEQGSCSPYAAFFLQPYPVFELTVKGYYGDPVVYWLSVKSFTTSFDAGTGNYKSKAEFYAYSYAFLSDILLGYVMAAPYMEGSDAVLTSIYQNYLKYYKEMGYNQGTANFNPITANNGRPITIFNYVKKLQELTGQGNSDEGAIAEIQNSTELFEVEKLDDLSSTLTNIDEKINELKKEWKSLGGTVDGSLLSYGIAGGGDTGIKTGEFNELYATYFGSLGLINIEVEVFNEVLAEGSITNVRELNIGTILLVTEGDNLLSLDLSQLDTIINTKRSEISAISEDSKVRFKEAANQKIKSAIGFIPTVRSFFTTLIGNTDLFLELLRKVSYDAEVFHSEVESDTYRYRGEDNERVSNTVFAWPTFIQTKEIDGVEKDVEVYPGVDPKAANWPEVKFVEDFLKAYTEMQKDIEAAVEEDNPEVDPYDNIPGRDNYIPVNAMETPAGTKECNNSYYNLSDLDSIYKALGERFITLTNVTSANSNYINTSIISAASKDAQKTLGLRGIHHSYQINEAKNPEPITITETFTDSQGNEKVVKRDNVQLGEGFPIYERINYARVTPYFSMGVPFVPKQWGSSDLGAIINRDDSILGYPNYIQPIIPGKPRSPMGVGSFTNYSGDRAGKDPNGDALTNLIYNSGEVKPLLNDSTELVSSVDDRVYYLKTNADSASGFNVSTVDKSLFTEKLTNNGDTDLFIISEPIFYTKRIIYFWAGLESVISRQEQFNQIPQNVKDKSFIVMAAGTTNNKQNTLKNLQDVFSIFYGEENNKRKLSLSNTTVDFSTEFESAYSQIFIGYSAGGLAITKNTTTGGRIGLIDPSLDTTQINNSNKWQNTFMLWGSPGMISLFGGDNSPNNYETLQATIIGGGGKSEKVNGLNHGTAINDWFNKYGDDILDTSTIVLDEKIIKLNTVSEKTTGEELSKKQELTSTELSKPNQYPNIKINTNQLQTWRTLGAIEAQNVYNSIENVQLLGSIMNKTSNFKELQEKIIELLGITGNDIYEDLLNEAYRYDKPIVLNRMGRSNGGPVVLTPDIHTMNGSDLVRLNRFDNATENGFDIDGNGSSITKNWYKNKSGRKGFGISEDSTFKKSFELKGELGRYGIDVQNINDTKSQYSIDASRRLVKMTGYEKTPSKISDANEDDLSYQIKVGYHFNGKGLYVSGNLLPYRGGWKQDSISLEGGTNTNPWQYNNYTNSNLSILDKFLTVDIFPDKQFDYDSWTNVFHKAKWGGDFAYRYSKDLAEYRNKKNSRDLKYWYKNSNFATVNWGWTALDFYNKSNTWYNFDLLESQSFSPLQEKEYQTHYSLGFVETYFSPKDYKESITSRSQAPVNYEDLDLDFSNIQVYEADALYTQYAVDIQTLQLPVSQAANEQQEEPEPPPTVPTIPPPVYAPGFALQGSILKSLTDETISSVPTISTFNDLQHNGNSENVSNSITDIPFWKHNLPSDEVGSNVRKQYYSFFGGGSMNTQKGLSSDSQETSDKQFYMGVQNDLDSWATTSKYFPAGFSQEGGGNYMDDWNYSKDLEKKNGIPTPRKQILTNQNKTDFDILRNSDGDIIQEDISTAYNKTKAWKGSLGYLFLANQYHKPWTGLYSSSLKNLGQQGALSLSSMSIELPRHSVLLLGAVLWRMRESGLLLSDDPKWNMDSKITGGVDPVNFPLVPKRVEHNNGVGGKTYLDFENWITTNDESKLIDSGSYITNYGVRPPTASFIGSINRNKDGKNPIVCFPQADEWPVVNTGMIHAYDFFKDKGVQNPFKRQYRIFTPIFANNNARLLRYTNQSIRYTTGMVQVGKLAESLESAIATETAKLNDYSESAKANITKELSKAAQETYNSEIEKIGAGTVLAKLEANEYLGGSEEGFTRFSMLCHYENESLYKLKGSTLEESTSVNSANNYSMIENGRMGFYNTSKDKIPKKESLVAKPNGEVETSEVDSLEYLTIEIKTYTELENLLNNKKFTKSDGETINCEFVKEITDQEIYEDAPPSPQQVYTPQTAQLQASSSGNSTQGKVACGQVIIEPGQNWSDETDIINYEWDYGRFYVESLIVNLSQDTISNNTFTFTKYSSYKTKAYFGEASVEENEHKHKRNLIAKVVDFEPGFEIDTESDNLYRYIGKYDPAISYEGRTPSYEDMTSVRTDLPFKAKQGRKFKVLILSEETSEDNNTNENNSTVSGSDSIDARYILELKDAGYLRGYTPIGPDIWFLPTSVKEIFIKEFEDFVGDFNNYGEVSELDQVLKTIDPLNFPNTNVKNRFGVFSKELTYPLMLDEAGTKLSDAPTVFVPTTEEEKVTYKDVELDEQSISKLPKPLIEWKNLFRLGIGSKPTPESVNSAGGFTVKEQSPILTNENVQELYNTIFNSYYILTSTTPRTFSAEFPLKKDSNGNLTETTNDYFRFSKQELLAFTAGFIGEFRSANLNIDLLEKIKDKSLQDLNAEALGANQDDDIRLSIYRSFKVLYDKWISASDGTDLGKKRFFNPIGPDRLLIDHFSFVDRINNDIGDKALVNLDVVLNLFNNSTNSIFGVCSDVCDKSNFNFFPLASYVDLTSGINKYAQDNNRTKNDVISRMFSPLYEQDVFSDTVKNMGGPHFLAQYVGGNSQELDLSINKEDATCLTSLQTAKNAKKEKGGDGVNLDDETSPLTEGNVVGFKVGFGSDTQSHFQGINLDQAEYKNTQEAMVAMDMLANSRQEGGSGGFVAKSQSLYPIFLNRSYSCTVEGLGNMMIQPLQYFQLTNVPMFYGAYLIREVKHSIRPHNMKTTFTGDRVPRAVVPIVEDFISTFKISPTQTPAGGRKSISTSRSGGSQIGNSNLGDASGIVIDRSEGLYLKSGGNTYIANQRLGLAGTFLEKIIDDYNNFRITKYPSKNWAFGWNGVTRSLEQTVKGGPNRDTKSLHGAGLAIDVQFLGTFKQDDGSEVTLGDAYKKDSFPGEKRYGYIDGNITAVQDVEFVKSIFEFITTQEPWKSQITWGATFYGWCSGSKKTKNCRNIPNIDMSKITSRKPPSGMNLTMNEFHHFQIKDEFLESYWRPYKEVIEKFNLPYPPLKSSEREKVYKYPFSNPGAINDDNVTSPTGDAVASDAAISPDSQTELNGPGASKSEYGVSDYQLFTYLAWQQGASGAAQHYSLWKRNGKKTKYTIKSENLTKNWPGNIVAKNGVKKSDINNLYGTNQSKLAEGFVDVWRQQYAKKSEAGLSLINSDGKNRSGVPYSKIKSVFEKYQSPPELDYEGLVSFGMIENGLQTDTNKKIGYQTMFQMSTTYFKDTLAKIKVSEGHNDNYQEWDIETTVAAGVPKIKENFQTFKNAANFK